jgi:hypothetical protein
LNGGGVKNTENNGPAGLPDFSWSKLYQSIPNDHKQCIPNGHTQIIPDGHKLYQTEVKYTNIFHSKALKNIPICIGIFGMKINHMATL